MLFPSPGGLHLHAGAGVKRRRGLAAFLALLVGAGYFSAYWKGHPHSPRKPSSYTVRLPIQQHDLSAIDTDGDERSNEDAQSIASAAQDVRTQSRQTLPLLGEKFHNRRLSAAVPGRNKTPSTSTSTIMSTEIQVSPLADGAQPQTFRLLVDTSSPAVFVPDVSCSDCDATTGSGARFDSSVEGKSRKILSVPVGRFGTASGYEVTTKLAFSQSFFVEKQNLLSAYALPPGFAAAGVSEARVDGYLGLGKINLPLAKDSVLLGLLLPDKSGMGAVAEGYFYVESADGSQSHSSAGSGGTVGKAAARGTTTAASEVKRKILGATKEPPAAGAKLRAAKSKSLVVTTEMPSDRYNAKFGVNWLPTLEEDRFSQWFVLANGLTIQQNKIAGVTTSNASGAKMKSSTQANKPSREPEDTSNILAALKSGGGSASGSAGAEASFSSEDGTSGKAAEDVVIIALDFGASDWIVAPAASYTSLMESISQLPGVTNPLLVPCAVKPQLPTLVFDVLHERYTLSGADYTEVSTADSTKCHIRVSANPTAIYWTLGASFHEKYAVTYDFVQGRIGLPRSTPANWVRDNWLSVAIPVGFGVWMALLLVFVRTRRPGGAGVWGGGLGSGVAAGAAGAR